MATALYATILTTPASVEAIQRYLYAPTEVVEVAPVVQYDGDTRRVGDKVFLVLRTEERTEAGARSQQQQQIDRLASGLHWMVGGFDTRQEARAHVAQRAVDEDWGLHDFAPFVLSAVST